MDALSLPGLMSASQSDGGSGFNWTWLIIVALVVVRMVISSRRARKKAAAKANSTARNSPQPNSTPPNFSQFDATYMPPPAPQPSYENTPNNGSFATQRQASEQALRGELDALDALRRSGAVTAEQYTARREEIFKKY